MEKLESDRYVSTILMAQDFHSNLYQTNDFAGEKFASIEVCKNDCPSFLPIGTKVHIQPKSDHVNYTKSNLQFDALKM